MDTKTSARLAHRLRDALITTAHYQDNGVFWAKEGSLEDFASKVTVEILNEFGLLITVDENPPIDVNGDPEPIPEQLVASGNRD